MRSDSFATHQHPTELIDTPGVCDSSMQSSAIVSAVLEKSTAYVISLPCDKLEDIDDFGILQEIHRRDPGWFMWKVSNVS